MKEGHRCLDIEDVLALCATLILQVTIDDINVYSFNEELVVLLDTVCGVNVREVNSIVHLSDKVVTATDATTLCERGLDQDVLLVFLR